MTPRANHQTAFIFAGGGSLGAVEVGMLKALLSHGIQADFVVGSSVGALNAAYFAGDPTNEGIRCLEKIWLGLRRQDVFPITPLKSLIGLFSRRNYLLESTALGRLLEQNLPYQRLEETKIPCYIVATDIMTGVEVSLSSGPIKEALLASAAIPGVFPPVRIGEHYLVDGGVANNTPVSTAIALGANRLIVLPTGYACTLTEPPQGVIATALHALSLIIVHQLVKDIERFATEVNISVVPPLCPVAVSSADFNTTGELIDRSDRSTERWLSQGGLTRKGVPHELPSHSH